MRTIDTHPLGHSLLAEPDFKPVAAEILTEHLTDIHPQDGGQSRILLLRIIILD
jgi:hypothetical protein